MDRLKLNGSTQCKYCGAAILFLRSKKGSWYPVDTAVLNGEVVPLTGRKTGMVQFHNCKKEVHYG